MDKSYLIHNIKFADSAADGHQTVDIELTNLTKESSDITADVTITYNTAGAAPETASFEGVSLTGAGGGGDFATCTGTITDEDGLNYKVPILFENNGIEYIVGNNNVSGEFEVVLYKGHAVIFVDEANTVTISGNITELAENVAYLVTGDFSVTLER